MDTLNCIVNTTWFNLLLFVSFIIVLVIGILNFFTIQKMKKEYQALMLQLGKGKNFNEGFNQLLKNVNLVSQETKHLKTKTENLEKNVEKCVQKIGIVRYNAYGKTENDLCFAVALLDFEDNGVVINGIYSRDNTTTTYAKPIEHGESKYTLVKEEIEAVELAKHNGYKSFLEFKKERVS